MAIPHRIVEHLAVPHTGILSRTAANRSWGYEVLLSRAYAWFGRLGIGSTERSSPSLSHTDFWPGICPITPWPSTAAPIFTETRWTSFSLIPRTLTRRIPPTLNLNEAGVVLLDSQLSLARILTVDSRFQLILSGSICTVF